MGWGSDDDSSPANDAVQQQINMNQQELEQKRKSLYSQRLDIIKTQGATNWSPTNILPGAKGAFSGKPEDVSALFARAMGGIGQNLGKAMSVG